MLLMKTDNTQIPETKDDVAETSTFVLRYFYFTKNNYQLNTS